MAKKNKLWFSGEDAQLAARFTKFMTKVLYARRASYIRALMVKAKREVSIEECRDEVDTVYRRLMNPIEESVESKLMWEGIKKYLHKLTPKECEVMISLYVDHLSVRETAAKLKVDDSTVSTHHKNVCQTSFEVGSSAWIITVSCQDHVLASSGAITPTRWKAICWLPTARKICAGPIMRLAIQNSPSICTTILTT